MAEPLGVDPGELRVTTARFDSIGKDIRELQGGLKSDLDAQGECWGKDKWGKEFSEGPTGYLAQLDHVMTAIETMAQLIERHAAALDQANKTFQAHNGG